MTQKRVIFLTEEDREALKAYLHESRSRNKNERSQNPVGNSQTTPDVHVAYVRETIPAITGTGTGSSVANRADCEIYEVDLETGELIIQGDELQTVFNISSSDLPPGWALIYRSKFNGVWVAGPANSTGTGGTTSSTGGDCNCQGCFNCLTNAQAIVTTCANAPDGAAFEYTVDFGTWVAWPTLGGAHTLRYQGRSGSGTGGMTSNTCQWLSEEVTITVGTGGDYGVYQWVYEIFVDYATLSLTLVSGTDVIDLGA